MKVKWGAAFVVAVALVLSISSVNGFGRAPADAAAAPPAGSWDLEAYGPRPEDNVVLKWNEQLLATIRANPPKTGPTVTSRALGVTHTAMYDAWAAYDGVAKGTRLGSQLRKPAAERTPANKNMALSFAAYKTLNWLFPDSQFNRKASYDAQMAALGYDVNDTTSPAAVVGNTAAQAVIDYRTTDGSNQQPNGTYPNNTTYQSKNTWNKVNDKWAWQPLCVPLPAPDATTCSGSVQAPATPQWGNIKMFGALAASQYRVNGPPKNANGTYSTVDIDREVADAADLDDVKKAKAEYWADGPGSVFPPGHDFIFAQALSRKRGHTLDFDVKFFFMLGNAMMDAGIASWWQKYRYDFVRPITAIRENKRGTQIRSWLGPNQGFGWVDGSQWRPYQAANVVTPPFPEYVSGHSTFSGAGAYILAMQVGNTFGARMTIKANTSSFEANTPKTDVMLYWPTFTHTGDEASWSRRWGGIHFYTGDLHGRALGSQVAQYTWVKANDYIAGRTAG